MKVFRIEAEVQSVTRVYCPNGILNASTVQPGCWRFSSRLYWSCDSTGGVVAVLGRSGGRGLAAT